MCGQCRPWRGSPSRTPDSPLPGNRPDWPGVAGPARDDAGRDRASYPGANGRIAFVRGGNIFTIEPSGSGSSQLTIGARHCGPRWSPGGSQIAYLYQGNLWIMAANGSHKTKITHGAPAYTDARHPGRRTAATWPLSRPAAATHAVT